MLKTAKLVVSRDMGWRNASRTRNAGAAKALGEVLCFIDDASLDFWKLLQTLQAIRNEDRGCFIWHDPPHLLILSAETFLKAGGYDERFRPRWARLLS